MADNPEARPSAPPEATPSATPPASLAEQTPPALSAPPLEAPLGGMTPPPAPLEVPTSKKPLCPTCKTPLEVYVGENVHKLATAFCRRCGLRHTLI